MANLKLWNLVAKWKKSNHGKRHDDFDTTNELLMKELKKIYQHEKELLVAIPLFMMGATTFELVNYLTVHVKYTREHVKLLEELFPTIGE